MSDLRAEPPALAWRRRCGALLLGVGAAALALVSLRTFAAERRYEAGLALEIDRPEADIAGRLAMYDDAISIHPLEPIYSLRAGQIRLARIPRTPRSEWRPLIDAARADIQRSAARFPLDPRTQIALAQIAQADNDVVIARDHAEAAAKLGPRHAGAQAAAVRVLLWAWQKTKDPEGLVSALEVGRSAQCSADNPAPGADANTMSPASAALAESAAAGTLTVALVLDAASARPDLLAYAARIFPAGDPASRARLLAAAGATGIDVLDEAPPERR